MTWCKGLLLHFLRSGGVSGGRCGCDPDWLVIDRVIAVRTVRQTEYYVKWTSLGYSDSTWFPITLMTELDKVT